MKKIIAILVMFLLVLTACSSSNTIYPTQTEQNNGKAAVQGRVQASGTDYEAELEKVKADTIAKNDKQKELSVPYTFKTGKPGEVVTFGTMFNSINRLDGNYFAKVTYIEARDTNSNPIEVDRKMVSQWIRESQTSDVAVPQSGSAYIPITFTIGNEVKSGVKTVSGAYTFEIQMYSRGKDNLEQKLDGIVKNVYLRVE